MTGAAIFHHPDAVESADKPLAGRRTAGQSFLAGLVAHSGAERLTCAAASQPHVAHFKQVVERYGWTGPIDGLMLNRPGELTRAGVIQLPGPTIGSYAWPRRRVGQTRYSLCGITHTVSTRRITEGLLGGLSTPLEEWDAIICTSRAVHSVVNRTLDDSEAWLRQRFAATRVPRPQLPIVPLGIDTATFARDETDRATWRARFDIGDDDIAVLSMGRLSVHEKMNPVAMFIALERAARATGASITLLLTGWFSDERAETFHREAASHFAPSVRVEFPNGRDDALRYAIWSAGDIFLFPVDNIQETFGLAPVEAMAAGLPVVCSDWNGFRDTIEHGVTGFRIPTLMSEPGHGAHLGERHEDGVDNYHQYLGFVHQRTAVDIPAMAEALTTLIRNPDTRRAMGAAGVDRARRLYDWSAVIPQFEAVWADLNARRTRGRSVQERGQRAANPASMDPFTLYQDYPTRTIPSSALLRTETALTVEALEDLIGRTGARLIRRMVTRTEDIAAVSAAIAEHGPLTLADLGRHVDIRAFSREGAVLWLAKFGLIEVET